MVIAQAGDVGADAEEISRTEGGLPGVAGQEFPAIADDNPEHDQDHAVLIIRLLRRQWENGQ